MNSKTILIGSLVFNLGLAGAALYVYQRPQDTTVPSTPGAEQASPTPTGKALNLSRSSPPLRDLPSTNGSPDFAWQTVQAKDFKTYIENLRAVDCPEETIRDIITAEVNKLYAKRIRNIRQANAPETKYWQSGRNTWNARNNYEQQKQFRAIQKEKSALLVELLGVDPNEEVKKENTYVDYWERNVQFLPEEKRDQVLEIQMKFTEEEQKIYARGGMIDDEDQKKIRELYKERLAELGAVLTPGELAEYDLRASGVANQLRQDLEFFNPTEDEYRKLFAIRKAREEDLAYNFDQEDKAAVKRRELAVKETDDQVKALLGEDRFQLYKRAPDWNYRELIKLVDRQELPRENVDKVYDMKKAAEDTATKIKTNSEYTQSQKSEMLKKIREDTEKGITDALGEKGWKKYNERQGWWLNSIAPQERKKQ